MTAVDAEKLAYALYVEHMRECGNRTGVEALWEADSRVRRTWLAKARRVIKLTKTL